MIIKTATLDGKHIAYTDQTVFLIEVGRNRSAYKTRYSIVGNLAQAVLYFRGINVGYGFKKRLRVPSFNRPILARVFSA